MKTMWRIMKRVITSWYTVARQRMYRSTLPFDAITANLIGWMHLYWWLGGGGDGCNNSEPDWKDAPVLVVQGGGAALGEGEHNNK